MKRGVLIFGVLFLFLVSFTSALPTCDNLISLYHMDGDASDSTGNNDGTIVGATYITSGRFSGAYDFDGVDDVITIPDNDLLDYQTGDVLSISLWVRFTSSTNYLGLIGKYNPAENGWNIAIDQTLDGGLEGCNGGVCSTVDSGLNDGRWHYIVYRLDDVANEMSIWVDAVKQQDTEIVTPDGNIADPLLIGRVNGDQRTWWNGSIDEVAIWNKALTSQEITELYNLGSPINCASSFCGDRTCDIDETCSSCLADCGPCSSGNCDGLVSLYHMDGDASDSTGNNDGTIVGATYTTSGKFSGAYYYDGSNDYIASGLPSAFDDIPHNDFSIALWVKPNDLTGYSTWTRLLEARKTGTNFTQFNIHATNLIQFVVEDANTPRAETVNSALTVGNWYHFVGIWDSSEDDIDLYLNGVLQSTSGNTGFGEGNQEALHLGQRTDGLGDFNGTIDEVAIWNRTLTSKEIIELYNSGLPINCGSSLSCSLADTSGNNIIEIGELISYISQWKSGTVTIGELITAIGEWKNGC